MIDSPRAERVYPNAGTLPLLQLLRGPVRHVLDVGCGSGDNARLLKQRFPGVQVCGITISDAEADAARANLDEVLICDLEEGIPPAIHGRSFDAIIFSHVLEHVRDPASVLADAEVLLTLQGEILVAVPNVLGWRQRLTFLHGDFT